MSVPSPTREKAGNSLPFTAKIFRMTGMERGQVKRESGPSSADEQAETKAIENWLRGRYV
jgi:hypothetical protein